METPSPSSVLRSDIYADMQYPRRPNGSELDIRFSQRTHRVLYVLSDPELKSAFLNPDDVNAWTLDIATGRFPRVNCDCSRRFVSFSAFDEYVQYIYLVPPEERTHTWFQQAITDFLFTYTRDRR